MDAERPPTKVPGPDRAPAPLVVAASLVAVEGVLLVLYGLSLIGAVDSSRLAMGVTTPIFFVTYGAALGYFAWRVFRLQSWARSPIVLAQLIQLGVAYSFLGGAGTVVTVVLALVALVVLVGIFHPASLHALSDDPQ
jgi:hypothetical protein